MRLSTAVVILTLCSIACGRGAGTAVTTTQAAAGPPVIDVTRIVERPVDVVLDLPGELEAYQAVAMFSKVTGFVKTIRVDRGSRVRAGELMAVLEAPELVAQRAEAESKQQAAEAQLAVARSKADADTSTLEKLKAAATTPGVVAGNDLILAEKSVEADRSQIMGAQKNVDAARQALNSVTQIEQYLNVTAPFDGVVTERNVHPGALVGPNSGASSTMPMLRVVDEGRLRLVIPVPEAYVGGVTSGSDLTFTVPAYPGEPFTGKVARIARAVDVKTRTMAVELDVSNAAGRLAPGSFCQVRWPIHRPGPSLLAPVGSIGSTTDRTFVVRIRNGKAEWVDVKTGLTSGTSVEIFGDVHAGDEIAVRGTDEIRPGTSVQSKATTAQ
jgi:RND family efflux transporter MFP subunit